MKLRGDERRQLRRHYTENSEAERASELDPLSLLNYHDAGRVFLRLGLYDQGIEQYRKALATDPEFPLAHLGLGMDYEQKRMYAEAIAELKAARAYSGGRPGITAALGHAFAVAGKKPEAVAILDELNTLSRNRYVSPASIATIYAGLGDPDRAFEWLEKAYQERSAYMVRLKTDPKLDRIRADPRFRDLVRRVGLPRAERIEALKEFERLDTQKLFSSLRDYVYEAYYTQPRVWKLIGYEFYATNKSGPPMKAFDESPLAQVRKKPKLYKEVS